MCLNLSLSQDESFPEELAELRSHRHIKPSSKLNQLSRVFHISDGLMLIKGRTLTFILLDLKHQYIKLLVHQYHIEAGHNGKNIF